MKRLILLAAVLFILGHVALLKYPGVYIPGIDVIYCTSTQSCLHEIGHRVDSHAGWITSTKDYQLAVIGHRLFLYDHPEARDEHHMEIREYPGIGSSLWQNTNPFTWSFWGGGWGSYIEFYADCLTWYPTENEMPVTLRGFYDWEFIGKEMVKYGR